ncbi:SDR family NAD(P)-dependent oxidoreductase [Sporolactobacillus pectinivorans]|uniref:SDR family NAD(P)-dependent oxidoreductase n=1 Tax=Sporolactobacillus pectinivorans TaxID=1591408 RepID=UPI001EFE0A07|nr:SDR family NAD(P)-dependent oxidoreductase [Sporolactobacillus pectinivorans]
MKNIKEDVALITGASHGIGLELARKMLTEGWQVIAFIRSNLPEDDPLIRESLEGLQLRAYQADLTDFSSLRKVLNDVKVKEKRIDILFNNAGGSFPELTLSKQNREMHYELQTVVPYIIFMELRPQLLKGQYKTVINTSSAALLALRQFTPESLEHPPVFKKLFGPYATSKLALSLWTQELALQEKAKGAGIKLYSVDPGGNNTTRKGKKSGIPFYLKLIIKLFLPHPSKGATRLYEIAMSGNKKTSGLFFVKGKSRPLKFMEHKSDILSKVKKIYAQEFHQ